MLLGKVQWDPVADIVEGEQGETGTGGDPVHASSLTSD